MKPLSVVRSSAFASSSRLAALLVVFTLGLSACGGGDSAVSDGGNDPAAGSGSGAGAGNGGTADGGGTTPAPPVSTVPPSELDNSLRASLQFRGLQASPLAGHTVPAITDPLAQLGKALFFTKGLSGDQDTACASCHHPAKGGGDDLSLPVGTGATNPQVVGPGRTSASGSPRVGRNAPSVLNIALKDSAMFWDGRVQSLAPEAVPNGAGAPIRTPDTALGVADPMAGANLTEAQSRFPVAAIDEMRGTSFEVGATGAAVRAHLAARLGNYGVGVGELAVNNWLAAFRTGFNSNASAEELITFENIAQALGEYQRSLVFVRSPWQAYVEGDNGAITDTAKRGALTFLATPVQGGGGCALCHVGTRFTDQREHAIAVPQFGPGKGDGESGTEDFGRFRESTLPDDRYRFATPGLLNVEVTGPWMHNGAYATLEDAVRHYSNTEATSISYATNARWCALPQFALRPDCATLYPNSVANTQAVLDQLTVLRQTQGSLLPKISLTEAQVDDITAFLRSLTDPCVKDRACLTPWIPVAGEGGPDGLQLDATEANGAPL